MGKVSTGHTVFGFSKKGFSCCHLHRKCQLGRLSCVVDSIDPEAKDYCHCYQRNHSNAKPKVPAVKKEHKEDFILAVEDDGQFTMF